MLFFLAVLLQEFLLLGNYSFSAVMNHLLKNLFHSRRTM